MQKNQIHLADWHRILFGDAPALFLVEVLFRTVVTYVLLLVAVRLLGKRMSGQLTITELAVMLTLGAIVSLAMQMPDRGVILCLWVLVLAYVFQRGTTMLDWYSPRFETLTQGKTSVLVKDGVLDLGSLREARLSREQIFATLRERNVFELGQVKRLYFEACGEFSLFLEPNPKAGLSTLPSVDDAANALQPRADHSAWVCRTCGELIETNKEDMECPHCGHKTWDRPALEWKGAT